MNKLDQLIKELEYKKLKIQFLQQILENTREYKSKVFESVKEDVANTLEKYITKEIESIEGSTNKVVQAPPAETVKADPFTSPNGVEVAKEKPKVAQASPQDALQFSLKYRHLSGKRLLVQGNGIETAFYAEVVGCDVPNLVLKRETGQIVRVLPESVDLKGV